MPSIEKKGITVKIDADLHAEIKAYLESHDMTMADFITLAVDNELHPKFNFMKENKNMENMRTLAFQVPESLFQRIKGYLVRNHMTQKQFVLGLIEEEIQRDEEVHGINAQDEDSPSESGELTQKEDSADEEAPVVDDFETLSDDEEEDRAEDLEEDEEQGMGMSM